MISHVISAQAVLLASTMAKRGPGTFPVSKMLRALSLAATTALGAAALVQVEQYGMAQCPMTSTLTSDFFEDCFDHGKGIKASPCCYFLHIYTPSY